MSSFNDSHLYNMNMIRRIAVMLILFTFGCESRREIPFDEKLKLYNDALDQVINDNHFQRCMPDDGRADTVESHFYKGKITEIKFARLIDSLKTIRKNTPPVAS